MDCRLYASVNKSIFLIKSYKGPFINYVTQKSTIFDPLPPHIHLRGDSKRVVTGIPLVKSGLPRKIPQENLQAIDQMCKKLKFLKSNSGFYKLPFGGLPHRQRFGS